MACKIGTQRELLNQLRNMVKDKDVNELIMNKLNKLDEALGKQLPYRKGSNLSKLQKEVIQENIDRMNDEMDPLLYEMDLLKSLQVTETNIREKSAYQLDIDSIGYKLDELEAKINKEYEKFDIKNEVGDVILNSSEKLGRDGKTIPDKTSVDGKSRAKLKDFFKNKTVNNTLAFMDNPFGLKNFKDALELNQITEEHNRYEGTRRKVTEIKKEIMNFVANDLADDTKEYEVSPVFSASGSAIQSPSRFLILKKDFNSEQKLPDNVTTAMAVHLVDWLAGAKDNRGEHRSIKDSKRLIGLEPNDTITEEQLGRIKDVDGFFNNEVESLGNAIYKTLGLKAKPGRLATERKMKLELGMMAISSIGDYVKVVERPTSKIFEDPRVEASTKILQFTDKGNALLDGDKDNNIAAHARRALEVLGIKSKQDLPSYTEPLQDRVVKTGDKHSGYNELQPAHQKAVNRQESVAHTWNERFIESYFGMINGSRGRLERILGVRDEKEAHKSRRLGVKGKNNSIKADMRHLEETYNDMKDKGATAMYFAYKVIKSLRFYMKSSTFNPQGKKLHRFSSYAGEPAIITEESVDDQKLGMALAFDLKIDKRTKETIFKEWDEVDDVLSSMLDKGYTDIDILEVFSTGKVLPDLDSSGVIDKYFHKDRGGIGEVAHLLGGIVEYKALKKHIEDNGSAVGFKSMLQIETDAVTSGFMLKLLQLPLGDQAKIHLARGGFFIANEKGEFEFNSFGSMAEMEAFVDSYQKPASELTKRINGESKDSKGLANNTKARLKAGIIKNGLPKGVTNEKEYLTQRAKGVLATANLALGVDYGKKIEEVHRNFMKDPFMVFQYGAGLSKIKGRISATAIEDLYKLMENRDNYNNVVSIIRDAGRYNVDDQIVADFLKNLTPETMMETELPSSVIANIRQNVEEGIGAELETVFAKEYKVWTDAGNDINNAFTTMFRLFKEKLDKAIIKEQYRVGAIPSQEQVNNLTNRLVTKRMNDLMLNEGLTSSEALKKAEKSRSTIEMNAYNNLYVENKGNKVTRELTPAELDSVISELSDSFPAIKTALAQADNQRLFINKTSKVNTDKTFNTGEKKSILDMLSEVNTDRIDKDASIFSISDEVIFTNRVSVKQMNTIRQLQQNGYSVINNFGNPFTTYEVQKDKSTGVEFKVGKNAAASIAYYNWLMENKLPVNYNGDVKKLNQRRDWILSNLDKVKNASKLLYSGTAKYGGVSHVHALIAVSESGLIQTKFNTKLDSSISAQDNRKYDAKGAKQLAMGSKQSREVGTKLDIVQEKSLGKIRIKGEEKPRQVGATIYEMIEAFASGGVTSIHGIDASIQAIVLSIFDTLGVHDANLFMANNVKGGTKVANKAVIRISKDYSITAEVVKSLQSAIDNATPEEIDAVNEKYQEENGNRKSDPLTVYGIQANMNILDAKTQTARGDLFSNDIKVGHYAYEGAEYTYHASEEAKSQVKGVNINSYQEGIAYKLTNPTYKTDKGTFKIKPSFPLKNIPTGIGNVEDWYKANNSRVNNIEMGTKADTYDVELMSKLIRDKFNQYPKLRQEVENYGGVEFLENSTHNIHTKNVDKASRWETIGAGKNLFIKALVEGYKLSNKDVGINSQQKQEYTKNGVKATPELDKLPSYIEGQRTMTYAGIGSRETPNNILELMTKASKWLGSKGYKLQTGKTFNNKEEGADRAFSMGTENKELFSPEDIKVDSTEWKIAKEIHPSFDNLTKNWNGDPKSFKGIGGAKLMARNTNQVFGANLDTPVDFVLFYAEETSNPLRPKGGTGQAVEMARRKGIPTINMRNKDWRKQLTEVLTKSKKNTKSKVTVTQEGKAGFYKRDDVEKDTDSIYLFGENIERTSGNISIGNGKFRPSTTQAVIRGLPNAVGVITVRNANTKDKDRFFKNKDLGEFKKLLDKSLQEVWKHMREGKNVILPGDGIGTGEANLKANAPLLYNELARRLNKLAGREYMELVPGVVVQKDVNTLNQQREDLGKYTKVTHYTDVPTSEFNFKDFRKHDKTNINQFGDGLNVMHDDNHELGKRYGNNKIEGYINTNEFPVIDASKNVLEVYSDLVKLGYKFETSKNEYIEDSEEDSKGGDASLASNPGSATFLFNDFTEMNKDVPGVTVINHKIENKNIDKFHVIYDSSAFYRKDPTKTLPKRVGEVFNWVNKGKKSSQNYRLISIDGDKGTFENLGTKIQVIKTLNDKRWVQVKDTTTKKSIKDKPKEDPKPKKQNDPKYELFPNVYANEGQIQAIDKLTKFLGGSQTEYVLKGRGGTGKTTIVNKVLENAGISEYDVYFTTISHKALQVIRKANKNSPYFKSHYAVTQSSLFMRGRPGEQKNGIMLARPRVIVVDEASMLNKEVLTQLKDSAKKVNAKILYMGDNVQLPPVSIGKGEDSPIFNERNYPNTTELKERMRQGDESPILPITDILANFVEGKGGVAFDGLNQTKGGGEVKYMSSGMGATKEFVSDYKQSPKETRYVWYNNSTHRNTLTLVKQIRRLLYGAKDKNRFNHEEQIILNDNYNRQPNGTWTGNNSEEFTVIRSDKIADITVEYTVYPKYGGKPVREFYTFEGEFYKILVSSNNRQFQGEIVTPVGDYKETVSKAPKEAQQEIANVSYAYVISSHKAQGSTYKTVYTDVKNILRAPGGDPIDQAKSLYVATSRPTDKLVMLNADEFINKKNSTSVNKSSQQRQDWNDKQDKSFTEEVAKDDIITSENKVLNQEDSNLIKEAIDSGCEGK